VEGLGPAQIDQLIDRGFVSDPGDLYSLTLEQVVSLERLAERSAQNLLNAIENSKGRPLPRLVFALGIRHVGETVARLLTEAFGSLDRLSEASLEELSTVPGVGPQIAESVYRYFRQEQTAAMLAKLREAGVVPEPSAAPQSRSGAFTGLSFVFTGSLETMGRAEAEENVRQLGGSAGSSVSKSTTHVVAGEKAGSKLDKAKKLGIPVLTEQDFAAMLRDAEAAVVAPPAQAELSL